MSSRHFLAYSSLTMSLIEEIERVEVATYGELRIRQRSPKLVQSWNDKERREKKK